MNYTKGEWKAEIGYEDSYIVCKSKEGITGIATVHKKNPMNPASGTTEANAHLIAAAPDMYEALKGLLRDYSINPNSDIFYKACLKARESLAKVGGKGDVNV